MSAELIVDGRRIGDRPSSPHSPRPSQSRKVRTSRPWGAIAPALLTIDVEDYYQVAAFRRVVRREDWEWYPSRVEQNVERLLDLLDEQGGVKATWFVLGWEAERRPTMVRRIAERGHEIGCHSYWHREVFDLTPEQFREDTQRAKRAIEQAAGRAVLGYRAPSFSVTRASLWALEILAELGFRYDSSVFPVLHPRYGIPDASPFPQPQSSSSGVIWELPPATTPFFGRRMAVAGGGYLRHLPPFFAESGLRHLTRHEKQPAVLYLHPWEIDPEQPTLSVGWLTKLRHYRNLSRTESRFARLLEGFEFWTCERLVDVLERTSPAVERAAAAVRSVTAGVRVAIEGS